MIPLSAVKDAATILGVALPVLVEALKLVKCAVEDCDVELLPADAPDLLTRSLENRTDLARRATRTDRASADAPFGASAFSGIDDGDADAASEVYGE